MDLIRQRQAPPVSVKIWRAPEAMADGPNVFGPQWRLLANQLAFVPRLASLCGLHGRLPLGRWERWELDCVTWFVLTRRQGFSNAWTAHVADDMTLDWVNTVSQEWPGIGAVTAVDARDGGVARTRCRSGG
jgi:hypothetical protein